MWFGEVWYLLNFPPIEFLISYVVVDDKTCNYSERWQKVELYWMQLFLTLLHFPILIPSLGLSYACHLLCLLVLSTSYPPPSIGIKMARISVWLSLNVFYNFWQYHLFVGGKPDKSMDLSRMVDLWNFDVHNINLIAYLYERSFC